MTILKKAVGPEGGENMKRYQKFLVYWLINSAILFFANLLLGQSVTIGNNIFAKYQAIVFSGFVWSFIVWQIEAVAKDMEVSMKDTTTMMLSYLFVNFATVWFIARFSFITGVGIANFWIVLLMAVAANLVQYLAWQYMDKKR